MLSRRQFLAASSASAAAPLVVSRPAGAFAADEKITLGFVGVGTMGRAPP